jgi:CyaY protein
MTSPMPPRETAASAPPLSESDYDALAAPALQQLITSLDALTQDTVEAELASDILTIEFDDGTRYVLNSHRAARQIWLSAERSAWHFDYVPGSKSWIAAKSGDELWSTLTRLLSAKLGEAITLR